jgi:hypothetical protein
MCGRHEGVVDNSNTVMKAVLGGKLDSCRISLEHVIS